MEHTDIMTGKNGDHSSKMDYKNGHGNITYSPMTKMSYMSADSSYYTNNKFYVVGMSSSYYYGGVSWTLEETALFQKSFIKYGKDDYMKISNIIGSKTATQVQEYINSLGPNNSTVYQLLKERSYLLEKNQLHLYSTELTEEEKKSIKHGKLPVLFDPRKFRPVLLSRTEGMDEDQKIGYHRQRAELIRAANIRNKFSGTALRNQERLNGPVRTLRSVRPPISKAIRVTSSDTLVPSTPIFATNNPPVTRKILSFSHIPQTRTIRGGAASISSDDFLIPAPVFRENYRVKKRSRNIAGGSPRRKRKQPSVEPETPAVNQMPELFHNFVKDRMVEDHIFFDWSSFLYELFTKRNCNRNPYGDIGARNIMRFMEINGCGSRFVPVDNNGIVSHCFVGPVDENNIQVTALKSYYTGECIVPFCNSTLTKRRIGQSRGRKQLGERVNCNIVPVTSLLVFDPNGETLAVVHDTSVRLFDLSSMTSHANQVTNFVNTDQIVIVKYWTEQKLVTVDVNGVVKVWLITEKIRGNQSKLVIKDTGVEKIFLSNSEDLLCIYNNRQEFSIYLQHESNSILKKHMINMNDGVMDVSFYPCKQPSWMVVATMFGTLDIYRVETKDVSPSFSLDMPNRKAISALIFNNLVDNILYGVQVLSATHIILYILRCKFPGIERNQNRPPTKKLKISSSPSMEVLSVMEYNAPDAAFRNVRIEDIRDTMEQNSINVELGINQNSSLLTITLELGKHEYKSMIVNLISMQEHQALLTQRRR
eukprot:TRINITY_DN9771_c0_g1_i1.p1 TRINITY_DN9771_c0_g1~~TRINITY_DN9771_c0_g1_i1.p1  ORF type:complete len:762 (-),score=153.33 TRINITY_DN9771_c0_g1_i1:34-2319(-)